MQCGECRRGCFTLKEGECNETERGRRRGQAIRRSRGQCNAELRL